MTVNLPVEKLMGASWRTQLGGYVILAIVAVDIYNAWQQKTQIDIKDLMTHIVVGLALLNARDDKVPSERVSGNPQAIPVKAP